LYYQLNSQIYKPKIDFMKKPKLSKKTKDILLELGIEILKTFKELNEKDKLKLPRKTKTKKGVNTTNANTSDNI